MTIALILGGTGTTGRRIAQRLRAAGHPVRAAARTGGDVALDLDAPATWGPALDGATAAYVLEPSLPASVARPARLPEFVAAAVAAGVRRLVLMTAGEAGRLGHPLFPAERAVRESGAEWTILRPTWFAQNFGEGFWRPGILGGTLALPAGEGRVPFIDADDIAAVAVSALTDGRHAGEVYQVTGPEAISFGAATELIAAAVGRPVRYADVSAEAFVERSTAAGVPAEVARLFAGLFDAIRDGRGDPVSGDVQRALGRPPRAFADYVADTATAGGWG